MPKWIGNRFGSIVPIAPDVEAPSAIYNLFDQYYSKVDGGWVNPTGHTATGGVISDYTTPPGAVYRAHVFTSSGTFNVTAVGTIESGVEYLVVAGGGGGAVGGGGGGGGAGGLRTNVPGVQDAGGSSLTGSAFPIPSSVPAPYTVTIGAGGAGAVPGVDTYGAKGSPSAFGPIASEGGGRGKSTPTAGDSSDGGSGGGGYGASTRQPGGGGNNPPTSPPQGNDGGDGAGAPGYCGGGGGGAGSAGNDGNDGGNGYGGKGGAGVQVFIAGPPANPNPIGAPGPGSGAAATGWFAGGGGGGGQPPNNTGGAGGAGPAKGTPYAGAGDGGSHPGGDADNALQSTGSGGGGGTNPGSGYGGAGGSGIVVVRYKIAELTATAKATGGAISFYGGKTIHTFTSSGTFATTSDWSPTNVEYVVVGGGGAGNGGPGPSAGGGGGAGGFITADNHPIGAHPVSVTVQIGAGAGAQANTRTGGTPSYFGSPLTAYGGGGGGRHINNASPPTEDGQPGGSGGGANDGGGTAGTGSKQTGTSTNTPITPQGNPGGSGAGNGGSNDVSGGGGGGAGQAGQASVNQGRGGHGGYGKQLPSTFQNPVSATSLGGSPDPNKYNGPNSGDFWFAGGGGGAASSGPPFGLEALGGLGGGGQGYRNPSPGIPGPRVAMDAIQNTGGGGGAFHGPAGGINAGSGGSGIVLIAYPS